MTKTQRQYGPKVNNNIGVSQGSEISARLCTTYLDDMMEDYAALNLQDPIPMEHTQECAPETQDKNLREYTKKQYGKMGKNAQENGNKARRKNLETTHKNTTTRANNPDNNQQEHHAIAKKTHTYLTQPNNKSTGKTNIQETSHQEYAGGAVLFIDTHANQYA